MGVFFGPVSLGMDLVHLLSAKAKLIVPNCQFIEEIFLPEYRHCQTFCKPILQQDNVPWHNSNFTRTWMKRNGIVLLDWPANSPDMNPIEDLWSIIKSRLSKTKYPRNKDQLKNIVLDMWTDITENKQDMVNKLALSFKSRCERVLEKKGDLINKFYFHFSVNLLISNDSINLFTRWFDTQSMTGQSTNELFW